MSGWCDATVVNAMCPLPAAAGADAGSGGFNGLAAAMAAAFDQLLQALLGFWSGPDGVGALDAPGGLVATLNAYTTAIVAVAATLGVIVAGTRLAITSSRVQEPARDLARGLLVLALVAGAGAAVVQAVRTVLDDAADGLLTQGFDGTPIGSQLVTLVDLQRTGISPGVTFLLGLLGALSTFAQLFVMVVRGPVLAVLVGVLPIAAASTMTGTGIGYVRRLVAWITALTVYKFVAGLLYAAAFLAVGGTSGTSSAVQAATGSGRLTGVVTGIALIIVAVGALPALVRLLTPAVEAAVAVGSGSGDGVTAPTSGAVPLSGRGRQGEATGPPSDAGAFTGPGLVRDGAGARGPTGTTVAGAGRGRAGGPAPGAPPGDDAVARPDVDGRDVAGGRGPAPQAEPATATASAAGPGAAAAGAAGAGAAGVGVGWPDLRGRP